MLDRNTLEETKVSVRPRRSGTVLVSFLGSVVRRRDNWMPIAGTVELMGQVGLDAPSSRTAVSGSSSGGGWPPSPAVAPGVTS